METLNGNHGFTRARASQGYEVHTTRGASYSIYIYIHTLRFAYNPQPFYKYLMTAILYRILCSGVRSVYLRSLL